MIAPAINAQGKEAHPSPNEYPKDSPTAPWLRLVNNEQAIRAKKAVEIKKMLTSYVIRYDHHA